MKPFSWMIALVLLCSTQMAVANCGSACDPCDSCCDWNYSVYADYLYWRFGRSDLNYDNDFCPDYQSGFRVGGALECDCWDFGARYTYFNVTHKEKHRGDRTRYSNQLDILDIELGYSWRLDCADVSFRPFAGAKLAWFDEKYHHDNGEKVRFRGYGLYLGTDASWLITCWCDTDVSLVTRGAIGILDGRHRPRHSNSYSGYYNNCHYIPYLEAGVGLNFSMRDVCGCFNPDLYIGYEVQNWSDLRKFGGEDDTASLGFGGLVLRLGLGF